MMCENAVNARVPVAVPGARGSSPLLKKVAGAVAATAALGAATAAYGHFVELNNFQLRTESLPVLPADRVILEVKYDDALPYFVRQLLKTTPAVRCAISKYELCRELQ